MSAEEPKMSDEDQWRKVDELMMKGGYFDNANEGDLELMLKMHTKNKRSILATAFEYALRVKKNGMYDINQNWLRENGPALETCDVDVLRRWRKNREAEIVHKRDFSLAAYAGIDSIIARKKREALKSADTPAVPPPRRVVVVNPVPKPPRAENTQSVRFAEFDEMHACLARM